MEDLHVFASGAKRSKVKPPYYLITQTFLERIAIVLEKGLKSYGANNWTKGDEVFAVDTMNHLFEHVTKFLNGDRSEDHLGHAACNLMFLDTFYREHPEWFDGSDENKDYTKELEESIKLAELKKAAALAQQYASNRVTSFLGYSS